ncbi:MAG: methyltransferase type 11 [Paenibacillus sp.]|jgi:ubiquinone/menaquinone biosynthesis C-methylase UbiE|nr:methyltransferase type 11 [Paenibacillus sp.]
MKGWKPKSGNTNTLGSLFEEPTAEAILAESISSSLTPQSRVLDVGCGHGEFTKRFASLADEVIGIDVREGFIASANKSNTERSARFVSVDANQPLPFPDHYFDVVYTKKGPWLFHTDNTEGYRILKPGGAVIGFYHNCTDGGLRKLFPGLYFQLPEDWLDHVRAACERTLANSKLTDFGIRIIEETEYLPTPEDVLTKKCFGQSEKMKEIVWRECFREVEKIFNKNASAKGLRVTNYYSIVTGKIPGA